MSRQETQRLSEERQGVRCVQVEVVCEEDLGELFRAKQGRQSTAVATGKVQVLAWVPSAYATKRVDGLIGVAPHSQAT